MLFFMPRYTINQFGEASDNVFSFFDLVDCFLYFSDRLHLGFTLNRDVIERLIRSFSA